MFSLWPRLCALCEDSMNIVDALRCFGYAETDKSPLLWAENFSTPAFKKQDLILKIHKVYTISPEIMFFLLSSLTLWKT